MARYMITSKCNMNCSYCVAKNVKILSDNNIVKIANVMQYISKTHNRLEITGGEPTLDPKLSLKILIAKEYFSEVGMRSATPNNITSMQIDNLDVVNISGHNLRLYEHTSPEQHLVKPITTYLSIGKHQYYPELPARLAELGWNGLTIWEDVWNPKPKSDLVDPYDIPESFSVRHLSSDECLDQLIILPDLDVITGREYEQRFLGEANEQYTNYPMPMPRLVAGM